MFQRSVCAALLALSAPIACVAQPAGLKASGVEVLEGGWKSPNHVGASFTALMAAQDGKAGKFDYYYQVRVVNEMRPTFANCRAFDTSSVFEELFGTKDMRTMLVSVGIRYRVTNDAYGLFQDKQVPLVFVGYNKDSGGAAKRGCFFEPTESTSMILSRYDGASAAEDREDFKITVTAQSGEEVEFAFVKRLKELFVTFNTAFSWTQIAAGKIDAFEKVATEFETAVNNAGDLFKKYGGEFTLEAVSGSAGRLKFSMPRFVARTSGSIFIYPRLVASLLIDTKPVTIQSLEPNDILMSCGLMTRECAKQVLAKKSCDKASQTVHEMLAVALAAGDPALFDLYSADGRKKLFKSCQKLRFFTTSTLELSTMDALLTRWAAVKYFDLPERLGNADELKKLATENGVPEKALVKECWADDDQRKLEGFIGAINHKI